jgi:hypothetical protein
MPVRVHHVAFIALLALTGHAHAQTAGGTSAPAGSGLGVTPSPGTPTPGNPTGAPAPGAMTGTGTTTGSSVTSPGTTAPPVAGVPNTSTPGMIGTGASPSGLPGDDPAKPGFPKGPSNTGR